jgi:hypothetical protein
MKCIVYILITGSYKPAQNKLQEMGGTLGRLMTYAIYNRPHLRPQKK